MTTAYHILLAGFLIIPVLYCLIRIARSFRQFRDSRLELSWKAILNTAVVYALAFNLIFFWQELFLALGKKWLGLTAYLYHNNHGWEGSDPLTPLMQGSGALAILVIGVVMMFVDWKVSIRIKWLRDLVFWLGFHGLVLGLPQFQTAMLATDTDTGQMMSYLEVAELPGFLIAVIATVLLVMSLRYYGQRLVWKDVQNASDRFKIILKSGFLPGLIGTVLIMPFRILPWEQIMLPVMLLVICQPWLLAFSWMRPMKGVSGMENPLGKLQIWSLVSLVILLGIFQLILSRGVVV